MQNLRFLGFMTIGALVLASAYAATVRDNKVEWSSNWDEGEGRSIRHIVNGERSEFMLRDDGRKIKAEWRGDFELNATGDGVDKLDKKLEIEIETDGLDERLVYVRDGRDVEKSYYIDGEEQTQSDETDAAMADAFIRFLRASGVKADDRVEILLAQGGAGAVLTELDQIDGDHAVRRYVAALAEEADLTTDEIETLAEKLQNIDSDHDLRRALSAVLEHQTIPAELTPALLHAAQSVESDHDMRLLVEDFAERELNSDAVNIALGLFENIESDHDSRKAAEALFENDSLSGSQAARLLASAAGQIESDHDMRLILTETASRLSEDKEFADAWLAAFDSVQSDHDSRLALTEAAEEGEHANAFWIALIEKTTAIGSDHDQRLALQAIADEMGQDPSLRDAYRAAAMEIGSDHDRRLALEEIGEDAD